MRFTRRTQIHHAEGTRRNAGAAAFAGVLLDIDKSNSVRMMAPVGQTSRQPARTQCLQTSDIISQREPFRNPSWLRSSGNCSMNFTWRQLSALSRWVLS